MNENSKQEFEQYLSYLSRYASPPNTKHSSSRSPSSTQSNNNNNEQSLDTSQACQSCGRLAPNQTYVHEFTTNQFLYNLNKSKESECASCSRQLVQLKHEANRKKQAEAMAPPSPLSFRSTTTTTSNNMGKRSAFKPYNPNKKLHNTSFDSSSSSPSFINVNITRQLSVLHTQHKEEDEEDEEEIDTSSKIRQTLVTIHTDLMTTNSNEEAKKIQAAEILDTKNSLPIKEKKSNSNEEENESSVNRKKLIHNEVKINNLNNLNDESLQKQKQTQKTKMSDDFVYSFKKLISPPPTTTNNATTTTPTTTPTKTKPLPSQSNNNSDERIYTFKRVMPKQVSRALTRQATHNLRGNTMPNQPVVVVPFKNIKDLGQTKQRRHRRQLKSETHHVLSSDGDERNSLTFSSSSFQTSNDEDDDDDEFEFKPLSKKEIPSQAPTSKPTEIEEHIYESLSNMGSTSELDETKSGVGGEITREEKGEFNKEREETNSNLDVITDKISKENEEKEKEEEEEEEENSSLYATINTPLQKNINRKQTPSTLAPNTGYTYAIKDLLTKQRKIQQNQNEPPLKPPRSSSNNLSVHSASPAHSLRNQSPCMPLIGAKHTPTTLNTSQRSQSPAAISNKSGFSTLTQSLLDERMRRSRQSMNNTQESKKHQVEKEEESIPELDLLNEVIDEQSKPFDYNKKKIEEEDRTKSPPNVSRDDSILLNKILFGAAGIERPKPNDNMFYTEPTKTKVSTSATSSVTNVGGESRVEETTEMTLSNANRFLKSIEEKRKMLKKDYSHDDDDATKMSSSNVGQAPSDEILALHYKFKNENSITRNTSSRYVNEEQLYKIDKVVEESEEDDNNNKIESYYVNEDDENNEPNVRNRRERNMENVDNFERFLLNKPSVDDYGDDDDDQSFSMSSRTQNASFLSTSPTSYKRHNAVNSSSTKKSLSIKEKSKKSSRLKKIFKFK